MEAFVGRVRDNRYGSGIDCVNDAALVLRAAHKPLASEDELSTTWMAYKAHNEGLRAVGALYLRKAFERIIETYNGSGQLGAASQVVEHLLVWADAEEQL